MIQITEHQWLGATELIESLLIAEFEEPGMEAADLFIFMDTVLPLRTLELVEQFFDAGFGKGNWEY